MLFGLVLQVDVSSRFNGNLNVIVNVFPFFNSIAAIPGYIKIGIYTYKVFK